ncbi:MAG TPA: RHS repeat-associated core domain-containing protein [Candidatus Sulfotelmatobacter sp.]|nr:RHS repeat-associated core domain-containing protein [Candidatus Sulfotelmatobacter sp.]
MAGAATDSYDYDAFGNLINSTGSTPNVYLFAGEAYDSALGLYYNRARYLNTTSGRFWSMDTEEGDDEAPLSLHKYIYTNADPVDGTDPSGNQDSMAELGAEESISVTLNTFSLPTFNLARTQNQLTYSTVLDAPSRHLWEIKWQLAKPTMVGGEIVQHIVVNGGCHQLTVPCNAPRALNYDYWEAWEWPPFNSPTTSIFPVYGFDDAFRGPTGTKFNAEARFYPGLALPGSFVPGNPATGAGDLPSTIYDPQLSTANATPPVNRTWVAP